MLIVCTMLTVGQEQEMPDDSNSSERHFECEQQIVLRYDGITTHVRLR